MDIQQAGNCMACPNTVLNGFLVAGWQLVVSCIPQGLCDPIGTRQYQQLRADASCCRRLISLFIVSTVAMAGFGIAGALLGGANPFRGGVRVVVGGWVAMGITYGIGRAFGSTATA